MKYTLGLKGLPFEPHPKQIIYVENEYNEEVNKYQYTIDIVNSSYVDTIEINYKIEKAIRL